MRRLGTPVSMRRTCLAWLCHCPLALSARNKARPLQVHHPYKLCNPVVLALSYTGAAHDQYVASCFAADIDLSTITDRMTVRKAVQSGNVEDAIERVNDLNPEVRGYRNGSFSFRGL